MRIEICGGIGAGKTTLATLLGKNGFTSHFENFKANPFWEPFYSNPDKFNFETEITFLLQHYHDIKVASENHSNFVCDFSFYQDLAYAKMGLNDIRLKIFEEVMNEGINELGRPDLLVCLRCDVETLQKRIQNRGRQEENMIGVEFLTTLNNDIYLEAEKLGYSNKVIYIDSEKNNFVSDSNVQLNLLKLIKDTIK